MNIIRAKTAGFCFGVDRAVKLTYDLLADGHKVATLGPLIHNPQVVEDLEAKGALTCPDVASVPDGYEVIIRSHGVPQTVYDEINTRRLAYHDATCPFVAKIHKIAMKADENHTLLLVAGDAAHPEVQGIVGHTKGKVKVFANLEELEKMLPELLQQESIYVVAQTTFRVESWEKCKAFLCNVGEATGSGRPQPKMRSYGRHWWSSFFQYPKAFTGRCTACCSHQRRDC